MTIIILLTISNDFFSLWVRSTFNLSQMKQTDTGTSKKKSASIY